MDTLTNAFNNDYPELVIRLFCEEVVTAANGKRTYYNELVKVPQSGTHQFILVHVWQGKPLLEGAFSESITLIDPDGEALSTTESAPFSIPGTTSRHTNYFAYTDFVFRKPGTYECWSSLKKEDNEASQALVHHDLLHVYGDSL